MPQSISASDGKTYNFPDGTPPDKVQAYFKKRGLTQKQPDTGYSIGPRPQGPIQTPLNYLEDLQEDVKKGTGLTFPGRVLKSLGARGTDTGVPEAVGDLMPGGGTIQGAAKAAHGVGRVLQGHPIAGANEVIRGAGQAAAPVLAATQPEFLSNAMTAGAAGAATEDTAKAFGAGEDTSEFVGNLVTGLLGAKEGLGPSTKKSVGKLALAGGKGTVEPIENTINLIKETAKGAPGSDTVGGFLKVVDTAKKKINDEYGNAIGPYANKQFFPLDAGGQPVIPARILALQAKYPPIDAEGRAAQSIIRKAAADYSKPLSLGDLDTKRTQLNTELGKLNSKTPNARYTAKHGDVNTLIDSTIQDALRDTVYPEADRLAGKPQGYFANLKNQQMNLIRLEGALQQQVRDLHDVTVRTKAATPLERGQIRGNVGEGANPRFFLSNIVGMAKAPNPEARANRAVAAALKPGNPSAAVMALPAKVLLTGDASQQ